LHTKYPQKIKRLNGFLLESKEFWEKLFTPTWYKDLNSYYYAKLLKYGYMIDPMKIEELLTKDKKLLEILIESCFYGNFVTPYCTSFLLFIIQRNLQTNPILNPLSIIDKVLNYFIENIGCTMKNQYCFAFELICEGLKFCNEMNLRKYDFKKIIKTLSNLLLNLPFDNASQNNIFTHITLICVFFLFFSNIIEICEFIYRF